MKPFSFATFLLLASYCFLLPLNSAQPFDYPTAVPSTKWTNSPSLKRTVTFGDGATVRAILLRGNFGPSIACGFFCTGSCSSFLFSIFIVYTNSGSVMTGVMFASPQVVWTANRNRPVKENATLEFSKDGNLVLRDVDGSTVWSTNTAGKSVVGMNITDDGNLVLVNSKNVPVWSSGDYPVDSWVLGQTLRQGQRLTANVSEGNSARGQLSLSIVDGGFETYAGDTNVFDMGKTARKNSTYITFMNGSLTVFALSNDLTLLRNSIPLPVASSLQYMRLDYGGHLRLYEWHVGGWKLLGDVFKLFLDDCSYPTVCGEYGICSNGQCTCPEKYFKLVEKRQPDRGCSLLTPLSCQPNRPHKLLALDNVAYFNYIDSNAADIRSTTEESCKQACLRKCSCKAALFQYGTDASAGSCYLSSQLFSMINNKPETTHFNSSAYLKVQI